MTGVIGFLQTKEKHWLKKLIPLLIVIALVPIFNAASKALICITTQDGSICLTLS